MSYSADFQDETMMEDRTLLEDLQNLHLVVRDYEEVEMNDLLPLGNSIVLRGVSHTMAEWLANENFGPDNAFLLFCLGATSEHEEGLELLAKFAIQSIDTPGMGTPAETIQEILASPQGMDVAQARLPDSMLPNAILRFLLKREGEPVIDRMTALGRQVRASRVSKLYGYALSGLMEKDYKAGAS